MKDPLARLLDTLRAARAMAQELEQASRGARHQWGAAPKSLPGHPPRVYTQADFHSTHRTVQ